MSDRDMPFFRRCVSVFGMWAYIWVAFGPLSGWLAFGLVMVLACLIGFGAL